MKESGEIVRIRRAFLSPNFAPKRPAKAQLGTLRTTCGRR
jgi:hypothetical protein